MIDYFKADPWKIIEEGFNPQYNEIAESVFSPKQHLLERFGNSHQRGIIGFKHV